MSGLNWLRRKAGIGPVLRVQAMAPRPTETIPPQRGPQELAVVSLSGGTVAQAAANLTALVTAMRHGDNLVACGCWPRYTSGCHCPDKASILPR